MSADQVTIVLPEAFPENELDATQPLDTPTEPIEIAVPPKKVYCLSCRATRDIVNPVEGLTDKNRSMLRGSCGTCGRQVTRFV